MTEQKKEMQVFKSRLPSIKYILRNGKEAIFVQGRYLTDNPSEIAELKAEIEHGHPHLYIDGNERTLDLSSNNALAGLRTRFLKEFMQMSEAERSQLLGDEAVNNTTSESDTHFDIKNAVLRNAEGRVINQPTGTPPGFLVAGEKPSTGIVTSAQNSELPHEPKKPDSVSLDSIRAKVSKTKGE